MAALIASRLATTVYDSLKVKPADVVLWTDSQVVLHWLRSESISFKPFVGVRIAEIQSFWDVHHWRFIPTNLNPADDLSRGISVDDMEGRRMCGPEFLKLPKTEWPSEESANISTNDLEMKKSIQPCTSVQGTQFSAIDCRRFSSWSKLLRVTAYCLRFIAVLKQTLKSKMMPQEHTGSLKPAEIQEAETFWIHEAQKSLPDNKKSCSDLSPFDDNGTVRVGGRLRRSSLPYNQTCPILLSTSSYVSELILRYAHEKVYHAGVERTLNESRKKYWIVRGRNSTKAIVRSCVANSGNNHTQHSWRICHQRGFERSHLRSQLLKLTYLDRFSSSMAATSVSKPRAPSSHVPPFVQSILR